MLLGSSGTRQIVARGYRRSHYSALGRNSLCYVERCLAHYDAGVITEIEGGYHLTRLCECGPAFSQDSSWHGWIALRRPKVARLAPRSDVSSTTSSLQQQLAWTMPSAKGLLHFLMRRARCPRHPSRSYLQFQACIGAGCCLWRHAEVYSTATPRENCSST